VKLVSGTLNYLNCYKELRFNILMKLLQHFVDVYCDGRTDGVGLRNYNGVILGEGVYSWENGRISSLD
jgi:hypothetical protein